MDEDGDIDIIASNSYGDKIQWFKNNGSQSFTAVNAVTSLDDYNASDFIVKTKDKHYFGCSLKKKPKPNSADPTLINKAFDTILNGSKFDHIKKDITRIRSEYFAGLVRQAQEDEILAIPESEIKLGDKELFEAKTRDKDIFERAYINTRGSVKHGYNNALLAGKLARNYKSN